MDHFRLMDTKRLIWAGWSLKRLRHGIFAMTSRHIGACKESAAYLRGERAAGAKVQR